MEAIVMEIRQNKSSGGNSGFTLVELLLAVTISGLILAAVFSVYQYQQKHYTAQLDVTEMQQNIRAGLNFITRDIRMAGFEAAGATGAEIKAAKPDLFYFTLDLNEDGDTADAGEHVAYDLYVSPTTNRPTLGRTSSDKEIKFSEDPAGSDHWVVKQVDPTDPIHQPAAENIEHLHFYYLDEDGDPTTDEDQVRTAVVTMVARANSPDPNFRNIQTYTAADGVTSWVKDDNYRRRIQILTIECRNTGV
jgi:type IV pilus assembly protein PilW